MAIKVFSLPAELPWKIDYKDTPAQEAEREADHREKLKAWLISRGYRGPYTGRIYSTPVADSCAQYMIADTTGRNFALIHLPYGDGWQSRDVAFLTKTEILRRVGADEKLASIFAKKS